MALLEFIRWAPRGDLWRMAALALVSAIANALLIVAMNEVTDVIAAGGRATPLAWGGFAAAFLVFYLGNRMALLRANVIIERLLKGLRTGIMDQLRRCEQPTVERIGRGGLYSLVTQETNHLSVSFPLIVDGVQQCMLLCIALLYLAYLSTAALIAFIVSVGLGFAAYRVINREFRHVLGLVQVSQGEMLETVGDTIHGAKELRLSQRKIADVLALYRRMSRSTETLLLRAGANWAAVVLLGSAVTYTMIGGVAFILPVEAPGFGGNLFKILPVLLFCIGPVALVVGQSPMYMRADVGMRSLLDLERKLAEAGGATPAEARAHAEAFGDFREVEYLGMTFGFRPEAGGEPSFTVGPLDFSLRRGETVFLVGGNGSGKSTVLRMLTGLFPADRGRILVDGTPLVGREIAGFRELFSAIFVDFHLFDRLYGLEGLDPNRVNRMIEDMGLGGKVRYENGRLSRLTLSTGQRKRLALIASLLEDRPIYVFDEWSAEQDVHFREHFYTRILPDLKAAGKTVIAATHDERYWHVADRVVKMDLGQVEWERAAGNAADNGSADS